MAHSGESQEISEMQQEKDIHSLARVSGRLDKGEQRLGQWLRKEKDRSRAGQRDRRGGTGGEWGFGAPQGVRPARAEHLL